MLSTPLMLLTLIRPNIFVSQPQSAGLPSITPARVRPSLFLILSETEVQEAEAAEDGVRDGYAVTATYTVPEGMGIAPSTPLPQVLCAIDSDKFPSMSRARKSCRRGEAIINGREGRCISTASPGDRITLQSRVTPGFQPRGKAPFDLDVVYEDDALAVVYKPPGVVTHPPPGGAPGGSMRTAIQYKLKPPPAGTAGALYRPHTVHRLDKPTSGLLLCAKTKPALLALQRSFEAREVSKRYSAVVSGFVEGEEGEIEHEIDGKHASTRWQVVSRARSLKLGGSHLTLLALFPLTGRTHQLRIHCSEVLKCSIVGDKTYGGEDVGRGLFLSACELAFPHPSRPEGAEPLRVQVEPPTKFGELMKREQERWLRLGGAADELL